MGTISKENSNSVVDISSVQRKNKSEWIVENIENSDPNHLLVETESRYIDLFESEVNQREFNYQIEANDSNQSNDDEILTFTEIDVPITSTLNRELIPDYFEKAKEIEDKIKATCLACKKTYGASKTSLSNLSTHLKVRKNRIQKKKIHRLSKKSFIAHFSYLDFSVCIQNYIRNI